MDLNITQLADVPCFAFSHSAAEGGRDAGRNTWQSAMAGPRPLLSTPEEFQTVRDYFRAFGAWDDQEIAAWSENEIQALLLQFIAGEVRDSPAIGGGQADCLSEIDWEEFQLQSEAGSVSGNLFRGDAGKYYVGLWE